MEWVLSLFAGVGLAAATGFRVFVPLLGMSVAGSLGILPLSSNFEWLSSPVAMGALAIAAVLEIGTYFVPWLDNAMDAIAAPAAVGAPVAVAASAARSAATTRVPRRVPSARAVGRADRRAEIAGPRRFVARLARASFIDRMLPGRARGSRGGGA